ncbi:hypothetical protein GCM10011491_30970 [Brucella endophytica]|uniref:Uncharacterized protein n=1 Tax=Brucella endophytica TaxID=1963359 RepID=A0A916SI61_9HYPH|nr:hypothetical protein [Brucella endophytica]GGB00580.1 hypothetical protein GCM10011491_30970 [Brucella endophytica]
MADLYPIAGKKIYIGGVMASQAADFTAADFSSQTWTLIDGWETMGPVGDAVALITTPLINRGRDVKLKGTANAPSMQNNFAVLPGDPGQTALIAAGQPSNKNNYAFKIEGDDAPVGGTPSQRLFIGLVMGTPEQGGTANTADLMQGTIEINSNIVKVAAADGP